MSWGVLGFGAVVVVLTVASLVSTPDTVDYRMHGGHGSFPVPAVAERTTTMQSPRAAYDHPWLAIPGLGVHADIVGLRATHDRLTPPSDPATVGWWADGARPGDPTGSAVLAAHTTDDGTGALDSLVTAEPGTPVVLGSDGGRRLHYVVSTVRVVDHARLSRRSGRLFDQQGPGRLVLALDGARADGGGDVLVTALPRPPR